MRCAHEAHIVKISVQMSLISTEGDFCRWGIETPIFGEERGSSMVLSSLKRKLWQHTPRLAYAISTSTVMPNIGDVSKILKFSKSSKDSRIVAKWVMEVIEGAKWVSWVQRIQTLYFPADPGHISGRIGRYLWFDIWPIRPGFWPGSARKCNIWVLWTQETHFAPSITSITHFATILESFEDFENFKICLHLPILGISVDVDIA